MHCPVSFAVAEAGLPQGSMLQPASACRTRLQFATWSLFDEVDVQRSADCVYVVDSSDTAERLAASVPHASVYRVQPVGPIVRDRYEAACHAFSCSSATILREIVMTPAKRTKLGGKACCHVHG